MNLIAVEMLSLYDGAIDHFWGIGEDGKTYLAMFLHMRDREEPESWAACEVDPDLLERSIKDEASVAEVHWASRGAQWWGFKGWSDVTPADEFEMREIDCPFEHEFEEPDGSEKMTFGGMMSTLPDFYSKMQMPEYQRVNGVDPLLKTGDEPAAVCRLPA